MIYVLLIYLLLYLIDLLVLQQYDLVCFLLLMEFIVLGIVQGCWSLLLVVQGEGLCLDVDGQVCDLQGVVQFGMFLQVLDCVWQYECLLYDGSYSLLFRGGWVLMLDYEVVSQIELVLLMCVCEDGCLIVLVLCCLVVLLYDYQNDVSFVIVEVGEQVLLEVLVILVLQVLLEVGYGWQLLQLVGEDVLQCFIGGVCWVIEYLCVGDVFQVNLLWCWSVQFVVLVSLQVLYVQLCCVNLVLFVGLFSVYGCYVVSFLLEWLVLVYVGYVQIWLIVGM